MIRNIDAAIFVVGSNGPLLLPCIDPAMLQAEACKDDEPPMLETRISQSMYGDACWPVGGAYPAGAPSASPEEGHIIVSRPGGLQGNSRATETVGFVSWYDSFIRSGVKQVQVQATNHPRNLIVATRNSSQDVTAIKLRDANQTAFFD